MMARPSYQEPLATFMRRRRWANLCTLAATCVAIAAFGAALVVIARAILTTALIVNTQPCLGCF